MSVEHVHALAKGVRLSQYEIIGILGSGGFGITYMARDTTLDTLVAIKEYLPGDFAVRQGDSQVTAKSSTSKGDFDWGLSRFLDEARVLAKFRHPNIVHVNQIFEANHTAYIVMEYEKGEPLDDFLKRTGPISEQQTTDILFPILDGLKRVHELGFLHRDIKPSNIIIRHEGGAVLIDFGAARQAMETKSRAITSIVTEGYAPLEQYDTSGNQGAWTDIYALGGLAYTCVTGKKPPAATSRLRNDPLVPLAIAANGRVSPAFAAAIDSALSVFENQRPQSIGEFAALISGAAPPRAAPSHADDATRIVLTNATRVVRPDDARAGTATAGSANTPTPPTREIQAPPAARMRFAALGAAAAAVLIIVAGGWFYWQRATVPTLAANDAGNADVASAQSPVSSPAVAPAAVLSPTEPPPSPNVAGSTAPAVPPATASTAIEQSVAPRERAAAPQAAPAPPPPVRIQPSFDCAKAANDAERLVCSDSQLAMLDVKMADLYRTGLASVADTNEFSGEQVGWMTRRDVCSDKECLIVAYNERIKDLERWARR
ncbi:MAG TPA: protein kinase [Micropepsaceae bacterium]|nr:protein kinase [Micropepsaceae bacterium]